MKAILVAMVLSIFSFSSFVQAEANKINHLVDSSVISQEITKININKADVDTLTQSFKGIGRKRAEAIIAYRDANDGFKSIDDLALVKGIGKSFVEKNRQQLLETYSLG